MGRKLMKICLVAPFPPPYGGIANWSKMIKEYSENEREDVELVILNTSPGIRITEGRTLRDRVVKSGIEMLHLKKKLKQSIKTEKPDAIHITTSGSLSIIRDILFLKAAKRKKIATIYHIRYGRIPELISKNNWEWKKQLSACRLANKVIAIDQKTYSSLCDYLSPNKVIYIPNPINLEQIKYDGHYKIKQNSITFLGWVVPTKGIEELLQAWQNLSSMFPEWKLNIVGPYQEQYLEYLKNKYNILNVNFTDEMEHERALEILDSSEIFILPSYTEGFPNVVLEAMALKKAIIATNVGAIPDMLSDNCGVLIEKGNAVSIEKAIEKLILDPSERIELGKRAYSKVYSEYNLEKIFEEYSKLWRANGFISST